MAQGRARVRLGRSFTTWVARAFILAVAFQWLALGVGCGGQSQTTSSQATLTVAAASDLQAAFAEVGSLFEKETGAKVVFQFGSSGNLARQIEQGAPVDLFASASEDYVQGLVASGVAVADSQRLYALGRIALVRFRGSSVMVSDLEDLLQPEVRRLAIANPKHAPYGRAAREALEHAGLWTKVADKVVYGENVRQALQYVQTGNADAGIVALSIAGVPEVEVKPVDDRLYTVLRQSMVVIKGTGQEGLARSFIAFVVGEKGRPIMERYGFLPPEGR